MNQHAREGADRQEPIFGWRSAETGDRPGVIVPNDGQTLNGQQLTGADEVPAREVWTPGRSPNGHTRRQRLAGARAAGSNRSLDGSGTGRTTAAPRASSLIWSRAASLPTSPRPLRPRLARLPGHALLVLLVALIVAGQRFAVLPATPRQPAAPSSAASRGQLGDLQVLLAPAAPASGGTGGFDPLAGYLRDFGSAVSPRSLSIQIVNAEAGQTIADLARETRRSVETLLWANGMTDPLQPLPAGTPIRVPPVDGMLHVVHDGDTLESIAARYQVDVSAITGYEPNQVQSDADLVPYRLLMVPGGKLPARDHVLLYTVREGDTLATIAQYFGLHPETIVWANSLPNGDLIFPGQHLAILPTDGVMVTVQEGDTVESLAEKYGVDPRVIRDYPMNGLGGNGQLRVGQQVMIPGGKPPAPPPPVAVAGQAPAGAAPDQGNPPAGTASGHFIWPAVGTITQYFGPTDFWMEPAYQGYAHFHQGLDIANSMGTPIIAADGGQVIFAGWSTVGYGYAVAIDHGNGLVTWYGHMAGQPAVSVGQWVNQGDYLGPMGSTGASTGPHLHFAVLDHGVWADPLAYLP